MKMDCVGKADTIFVARHSFCSRMWYGVIGIKVLRGYRQGWDYQRSLGGFMPEFEDFLSMLVNNGPFKTSNDTTLFTVAWAGGETILRIDAHIMGPPEVLLTIRDRLKAFGIKLCLEIDQTRKFNIERVHRFMY